MAVVFSTADLIWTCRNKRKIRAWLEQVIAAHGFETGEIELIFCSDSYLLELNTKALQHAYYTDIITFDYCAGELVSGDLFVSLDRVKDNALSHKVSFSTELHRVLVHGVLHLCGWTDATEAEKHAMRAEENRWLSSFPS